MSMESSEHDQEVMDAIREKQRERRDNDEDEDDN